MLPHLQGSFDQSRLASHNAVHTFPVAFNTTGISSGVKVGTFRGASPTKPRILRLGIFVTAAFNATSTNVLSVGTTAAANEWIDQNNVAEGNTGASGLRIGGQGSYLNLAAATTTGAITQFSLNGTGAASSPVSPAHPRNVVLTITDANASISAIDITVLGTNARGEVTSENFTFASFTTLVATGSVAFATITSVTINSCTGGASIDKLDMGFGKKIGLPGGPGSIAIRQLKAGVAEALGTVNATNGTVTMTTDPDGSLDFDVYYYTEAASTPIQKTFRITADTDLYVKYTQSGTAATTGRAIVIVDEFEECVDSIL